MSTTTTNRQDDRGAPDATSAGVPVWEALRDVADRAKGRQDLYRAALRTLARHFDAPYAAVSVEGGSGTVDDYVSHGGLSDARWKSVCRGLLLDARYRGQPIAKLYDSIDLGMTFAALAVPIKDAAAGGIGAMAIITVCRHKSDASAKLSELQALVELVATRAAAGRAGAGGPASASRIESAGVSRAAAYRSLHQFAFALANNLKSKFGYAQVTLGLVRGRRVRVLCISGLDDLYPRSPGVRLIQQAMEECLDAGRMVGFQNGGASQAEGPATGHRLHRQWHDQTGNSPVASIPLVVEKRVAVVLSLRGSASNPLKAADLEKIETMVAPLIPGLLLMERAERSLLGHCRETLRAAAARWAGPGAWGRKIAALAALAAILWGVLGTTRHEVTVPCEIVSDKTRQIAAPFEGTIAAAHVEPGDRVVGGQVLVEMETRQLRAQRERIAADRRIAELELSRATADGDPAAAAQAAAKIERADAQLDAIDYRIDRAKIRAPADGVILAGDVRSRVGQVVPLGEKLLAFAPHGSWSLELKAAEDVALYLRPGQKGRFTTTARPDQVEPCTVVRVEPAAEVADGKNVFVVEAAVAHRPDWMRVGMTGVARIDAGRRPVWWVHFHRLIDRIQRRMWAL